MINARVQRDGVLFVFNDNTNSKGFDNVSAGGIVFSSYDHDVNSHRWGTIKVVGPDCEFVKVGDVVLIENLRWTDGFDIDGVKLWRTNETEIMLIKE
jgi:hypothetical protein